MSYLHISNLYKEQTILLFRRCFALEKIHGTSAHISFKYIPPKGLTQSCNGIDLPIEHRGTDGTVTFVDPAKATAELHFFAGGESHTRFVALFDQEKLKSAFLDMGIVDREVTIYGEAYGGSQQGMKHVYGPNLKFIVFDVQIGDCWLSVPDAADVTKKLGLEFVYYEECSTDLASLDAQRDMPSVQAIRNGVSSIVGHNVLTEADGVVEVPNFGRILNPKPREGVVLRPLVELTDNHGNRIICKHKGDNFKETATPRPVVDPAKIQVLADANAVANEWVTATRLEHVLDKLPGHCIERMRDIIAAVQEDVLREGKGEIVESDAVKKVIGKKAAEMYKSYLNAKICQK